MEGERRLLADLDIEELFNRLSREGTLVVRGAKVLQEHDVDGLTFIEMTVEDFKEIGISFGIRKGLLRFRNKVLEMEADLEKNFMAKSLEQMKPIKEKINIYASEPILDIVRGEAAREAWDDIDLYPPGAPREDQHQTKRYDNSYGQLESIIIGEACNIEETKVDVDSFRPGEQQPHEYLTSPKHPTPSYKTSTSDIFAEPRTIRTLRRTGREEDVTCRSWCFDVHDTGHSSVRRDDSLSIKFIKRVQRRSPSDALSYKSNVSIAKLSRSSENESDENPSSSVKSNVPKPKLSLTSQDSSEEDPSSKSMRLSEERLIGKKELKNWVFNRKVKWKEKGKQRRERDFMKLRSENKILLEGYLQKLEGLSRIKITHWSSRYGILLKSGVFLYFAFNRNRLFFKGFIDINQAAWINIPQTDVSEKALRLEIFLPTRKRHFLAFTTETELLMWRDELLQIVNTGGGDGNEDDSIICLE